MTGVMVRCTIKASTVTIGHQLALAALLHTIWRRVDQDSIHAIPTIGAMVSLSAGALPYPLSLVYSGGYSWRDGHLYTQGAVGLLWSYTGMSSSGAHGATVAETQLNPQNNNYRTDGRTLQCLPPDSTVISVFGKLSLERWRVIPPRCDRRLSIKHRFQ